MIPTAKTLIIYSISLLSLSECIDAGDEAVKVCSLLKPELAKFPSTAPDLGVEEV